jgi:hypothetical protein
MSGWARYRGGAILERERAAVDLRKMARVLLVGLVVPGLWLAGFATSAGSGTAEFEILKMVRGTPPPGAQFEVTIACDGVTIIPPGQSQVVLRFDAAGTPQDPSAVRFEGEGTCTVTETQTGGATSVAYECARTAGDPSIPPPCTSSGPQTSPVTLNVTTPRSPSSVAVTNTFEPPPAPVVAPPRATG